MYEYFLLFEFIFVDTDNIYSLIEVTKCLTALSKLSFDLIFSIMRFFDHFYLKKNLLGLL